ncbi:SDR family oxidoreductase [Roseivirga sp.]|uniref:SDR family oxidoreductase n=1 Tax=Roseivirga sp. TaxID=1964215 RepID=UPI002B271DF5|nr:SDR family oxidoreductase [Roseivirga sp.]
MTDKKQNILIAGANGTTGKIIVELLQASDRYRPIAMVRKEAQKEAFEKDGITAVLADLEKDLSRAVTGVDKVIFAAGSKGKKVIAVDQEGAKNLTDAAKKAGVGKFVMLSSMGADNPSVSDDLKEYLKAKQNADNHLRNSGLEYSIVRPGALSDKDGTGKIQLKEKLDKQGSISRADVAKTLVEVLEDGVQQNQTFEIIAGDTPVEKAVL